MTANRASGHLTARPAPPIAHRRFFGWRVVGAAFTVAVFGWGVGFYGPSVFLNALHQERGWSVSLISSAITCHFLISAAIITRLPDLYRRFGLTLMTRVGALGLAAGTIGWSIALEPWHLFAAAVLSAIGWATMGGAAIPAMVSPWFDRRRPAALSMAFNGSSIGGLVFTPLWAVLIFRVGFRLAALVIGLIAVTTLWWLAGRYLRPTPESMGLAPDGDPQTAAGSTKSARIAEHQRVPEGLRVWSDWRFATLAIAFALGLFAQVGLLSHLFSLLVPALGETGAGGAVALITGCAVVGRTLPGMILPGGANWRMLGATVFGVQVAGSIALIAAAGSSIPLLLSGCVLFGLGVGNVGSLSPLIAQAEFARVDVARVIALVVAMNQVVFAFGPVVLGVLRDATSTTWAPILAAGLIQLTAAIVVIAGIGRQRRFG
jgi:MFS family permease